jgi:hypothetical protein
LIVFSINDMSLLQEDMQEPLPNERMGSSDMGNVSQVVPSIHPCVVIVDLGTGVTRTSLPWPRPASAVTKR